MYFIAGGENKNIVLTFRKITTFVNLKKKVLCLKVLMLNELGKENDNAPKREGQ